MPRRSSAGNRRRAALHTVWPLALACAGLVACQTRAPVARQAPAPAPGGKLLLIGGGLDDDNRPVYERLLGLAAAHGRAHIVIMTAASGDQDQEITDKSEALRSWDPAVSWEPVRRETNTADTVAAIERATALFFTGGDQQRITDRYRPGAQSTPEWQAMQRLLQRGGVIAGASAGDAMMGTTMFYGGASATALGIVAKSPPKDPEAVDTQDDEENPALPGPHLGPGMGLLPFAMTDSHFFERNRVGRLVAALEATHQTLGIGVGEDASVEVDLATGDIRGVSMGESLLLDVSQLQRHGLTRTGLRARLIRQGETIRAADWLAMAHTPVPAAPGATRQLRVVDAGQNRQLASWRLFHQASVPGSGTIQLDNNHYSLTAHPAGGGDVAFEVGEIGATDLQ